MPIQPIDDRIVIQQKQAEEVTVSGLIIPDQAQQKPQEGVVIAVGAGRYENGVRIPMDVKVGDTVLFSKYGATEVTVEGKALIILTNKDVLGILVSE